MTVAIAVSGKCTVDSVPIALELTLAVDRWVISKPKLEIATTGTVTSTILSSINPFMFSTPNRKDICSWQLAGYSR